MPGGHGRRERRSLTDGGVSELETDGGPRWTRTTYLRGSERRTLCAAIPGSTSGASDVRSRYLA